MTRNSISIQNLSIQLNTLTLEKERIDKEIKKVKKQIKKAKDIEKVNEYFDGRDHLEIIQEICENLLGNHGDTISKCQKMLDEIYINIFDYVDEEYDNLYDNKKDLMKRCRTRGFFPKLEAKSQGLKDLLETFFSNRN